MFLILFPLLLDFTHSFIGKMLAILLKMRGDQEKLNPLSTRTYSAYTNNLQVDRFPLHLDTYLKQIRCSGLKELF